jgi:choline dehydrogenase-like flavoprotein
VPEIADVLVIGAGASGSVLTKRLAEAGIGVVCLEQGDWVNADAFPGERPEWDVLQGSQWAMNPNVRAMPADYPINTDDSDINPLMFCAVGGGTIHYAAAWPRLKPSDFRTHTLDGVGDDWPFTYEDLAPYYDRTDQDFGVSGLDGDPSYPPGTRYPLPALPIQPLGRKAAEGMDRLGWHWWPHPTAIASRPHGRLAQCARRGVCMTGCREGAKASTDITHWPDAIRHGARLVTGARVREITTDARGHASGAIYIDRSGVEHHQQARTVVMACNGIGTARLLLLSGLANASGLVGKRLMMHPSVGVVGVYPEDLESWKGPAGSPLVSYQFYETDLSRGFARGAKWDAWPVAGLSSYLTFLGDLSPAERMGPGLHATMRRVFGRSFVWTAQTDDLPDEANHVSLDPTLTDSDGIPSPKVDYRVSDVSRRNLDFQVERMKEAHLASGALETHLWEWMPDVGWHTLGTARCGHDPATSVVDPYGRAHDVANLFVVDGSVFVTGSGMNPTSTIAAFALRTADHIVEHARDRGVAPA